MSLGESNVDLTVFVPTRGRPKNLVDFASNFSDMCTGRTELVFVFDSDDVELDKYRARNANRWTYYVANPTRRGMVGALNQAYSHYSSQGQLGFAVGFMGDDHRPRTHGWDSRYYESLCAIGSGFVYGNDLLQCELMPTQVAFTTDIARAVGYMSPPELDHLCVDLVWRDWGKAIDRYVYLDDVIVEHMHPLAGKARNDKNYRVVNSNFIARHDNEVYTEYVSENGRLHDDIRKIQAVINEGDS